ncbi:MAG: hypothetical protein LLG37_08935 [Spirochaetia bacterium]|nr:hypothetical protein [Spirochaetia bacterium]
MRVPGKEHTEIFRGDDTGEKVIYDAGMTIKKITMQDPGRMQTAPGGL